MTAQNDSKSNPMLDCSRFSVAPMLDWTDQHCRYFYRIMSKKSLLYTEMISPNAILNRPEDYLPVVSKEEGNIALQLGGSDPKQLAICTKMAQDRGYSQVNLNCGCPSDRVRKGAFGACLMKTPELVADCIDAMKSVVQIPVTIKTRIGIDEEDSYEFLEHFINVTRKAGCQDYIIHARKAWLSGLSPKENREIPPLNYERVYKIKNNFPFLKISINGGISSIDQAKEQLNYVDGVMMGRKIYHDPFLLTQVDSALFSEGDEFNQLTRQDVVLKMIDYIENHLKNGGRLHHITRHMLDLFHGQKGARLWRQTLSVNMSNNQGIATLKKALSFVND